MIENEIDELGRRMGMSGLPLTDSMATLNAGELGTLTLEIRDTRPERTLLLSLAWQVPENDGATLARLLARTDWRNRPAYRVGAGVLHDRAVVFARLAENEVSASEIENAMRFLLDTAHSH